MLDELFEVDKNKSPDPHFGASFAKKFEGKDITEATEQVQLHVKELVTVETDCATD